MPLRAAWSPSLSAISEEAGTEPAPPADLLAGLCLFGVNGDENADNDELVQDDDEDAALSATLRPQLLCAKLVVAQNTFVLAVAAANAELGGGSFAPFVSASAERGRTELAARVADQTITDFGQPGADLRSLFVPLFAALYELVYVLGDRISGVLLQPLPSGGPGAQRPVDIALGYVPAVVANEGRLIERVNEAIRSTGHVAALDVIAALERIRLRVELVIQGLALFPAPFDRLQQVRVSLLLTSGQVTATLGDHLRYALRRYVNDLVTYAAASKILARSPDNEQAGQLVALVSTTAHLGSVALSSLLLSALDIGQ